jgi:DNA recombination protein RmuC
MEILIGLVVGIVIGVLLLIYIVKVKNSVAKKQEEEIVRLNKSLLQLTEEKNDIEVENAKIVAESKARVEAYSEKLQELQQTRKQLQDITEERESLIKINSSLRADNEAKIKMLSDKEVEIEKRLQQQAEQFKEQTETLKHQFAVLSEELLKEKTQELGENNKDQLTPFIESLKEEMKKVGEEIKDTREKSVAQKSSLDTIIRDMMDRTSQIGSEANKLAEALKGKSKTQGLYGELVLTDILKRSGLKEGEHFECQTTIRDEQGKAVLHEDTKKRMIPDVIVHYPDKDLIIDSKVSLTAYLEWCNAQTEEERVVALKKHILSIKSHINEIVSKSYAKYQKNSRRETIDCVVMFVPNEGALQLMREAEPSLWYEAYDEKVIITSELSLFALLKMIENYWAQVEQQRNQESIIDSAEKMLDRVAGFYKQIGELEALFGKVDAQFVNLKNKLYDGNKSIATYANQLMKLGVKSTKANKQLSQIDEQEVCEE